VPTFVISHRHPRNEATLSNQDATGAATAAAAGMGLFGFIMIAAVVALEIYICWRIASKAGYNGALSLLMLVPLANIAIILMFAFGEWPIEAQLRAARGGLPKA
jgi:energy-converting hydrogenase Eha subunit B